MAGRGVGLTADMRSRAWLAVGAGLLGLALATGGCGHRSAPPAEQPYSGPLYEPRGQATHPRAGAAGDVVQCRHFGTGGFEDAEVHSEGETADSPEKALDVGISEASFEGGQDGLAVAARTDDRVLFVREVDGVVKQAVIVHDGPATEGAGGPGWYVESWARCDWSELPASAIPDWLLLWTGRDGRPADTREIHSYVGPEHCEWQSMTFLEIGGRTYLREPLAELRAYVDHPYDAHAVLPDDAVATGFSRDGQRLWLAADHTTAYVGSHVSDVEAWPVEAKPLGCA